jgi:hypothetical protein
MPFGSSLPVSRLERPGSDPCSLGHRRNESETILARQALLLPARASFVMCPDRIASTLPAQPITSRLWPSRKNVFSGSRLTAGGLLAQLEAIADCYTWNCGGYCLMGTHFHLIVQTPEPTLSRGMQHLLSQWFLSSPASSEALARRE